MPDQAACLSRALAYYPERVQKTAPLIHCITNYVTAGDVANLLLAAGASPVMTDHPAETASTASASDGLVLNLGTLKIGSVTAMIRAGQAANRKGIPIIFDPVGIGVSAHRRHSARRILSHISVSIVRGNSSEIRTLANLFLCKCQTHTQVPTLFQNASAQTPVSPVFSLNVCGLLSSVRGPAIWLSAVLKPPASTTAARSWRRLPEADA